MTPLRAFLLGATCTASLMAAVQQVANSSPIPRLSPDAIEFLQYVEMVNLVDPSTGVTTRTVRISGVNVQLVNGTGATQSANGVGNLIVGYAEYPTIPPFVFDWSRAGSHNLIVGPGHGWPEWSAALGGANNIAFDGASVLGGTGNVARGEGSVIVAGRGNRTSAADAAILSGFNNEALGDHSGLVAGVSNQTSGSGAATFAGERNFARGLNAAILGGTDNFAVGEVSAVVGGVDNYTHGWKSVVGGGALNTAIGEASVVGGGSGRMATNVYNWRAGSLLEDF